MKVPERDSSGGFPQNPRFPEDFVQNGDEGGPRMFYTGSDGMGEESGGEGNHDMERVETVCGNDGGMLDGDGGQVFGVVGGAFLDDADICDERGSDGIGTRDTDNGPEGILHKDGITEYVLQAHVMDVSGEGCAAKAAMARRVRMATAIATATATVPARLAKATGRAATATIAATTATARSARIAAATTTASRAQTWSINSLTWRRGLRKWRALRGSDSLRSSRFWRHCRWTCRDTTSMWCLQTECLG